MKKQSAANRLVNEVSKVTTSLVHYNRSAAVQFLSQVIPELSSQQAPDSVLFPWHFAQKSQTGWRIILTCEKLFSPPIPQSHPCVQYWHRGGSRNAGWHSTSLCCTSPSVARSHAIPPGQLPHESEQPEKLAVTALPACRAKLTSE